MLGSDQCADVAVLVDLCEFLAFRCLVVAKIDEVVSRATLVLLASVEVINLDLESIFHVGVDRLHLLEPCDLMLQSVFTHLCISELCLLNFLVSDLLVCDCEVFVKALLFCNSYLDYSTYPR